MRRWRCLTWPKACRQAAIAARLVQLGVDVVIINRQSRIGDNWRKRYHSLKLHNEVHVNHLPYMPFPSTWPVFIPKDKLADWFEAYAESMELDFWTGTELLRGSYDQGVQQWHVRLRRSNGMERIVRPRHLVFATRVSSIPHTPKLPGLDASAERSCFRGVHRGRGVEGCRALVLGTGNRGHDVAQDLFASGARDRLQESAGRRSRLSR